MSEHKPIPPDRGIVTLDDVTKQRLRRQLLVNKADDRIPDEVWMILQECGESAAKHLQRILKSPGFEKRKIHEQIRVIELALLRSYGAPEGAIKRDSKTLPDTSDPERIARGNTIRRLANQARLPELRMNKTPIEGD